MSYGSACDCDREIRHLKEQVRSLEYTIDELKRDAERSIARLCDRIDSLRSRPPRSVPRHQSAPGLRQRRQRSGRPDPAHSA